MLKSVYAKLRVYYISSAVSNLKTFKKFLDKNYTAVFTSTMQLTVKNYLYSTNSSPLHYLHRVTKVIIKICVPEPRKTDNSIPFLGGLKISP